MIGDDDRRIVRMSTEEIEALERAVPGDRVIRFRVSNGTLHARGRTRSGRPWRINGPVSRGFGIVSAALQLWWRR